MNDLCDETKKTHVHVTWIVTTNAALFMASPKAVLVLFRAADAMSSSVEASVEVFTYK